MLLFLVSVFVVCLLLAADDVIDRIADAIARWNRRIQRSPYRVPCPRCGAGIFERCRGLQYETHISRDREAIEQYLQEIE